MTLRYVAYHIREYLLEFETEFKNILGCYSGALGQLIYEKNQRWKISWYFLFNILRL
jgi:hypothetical protein